MKLRLVANARRAWRWFSIQAMTLLGAIPMVWYALPPESQALVSEAVRPWVLALIAVIGVAGRLIDQSPKEAA